ncbi:MAG: Guanine nucleotide exchange factor lte1 [Thelocarpon superellum]|nr:MAG: Guanine nucleotide exchange factor lte1 [Thelocarpon superellum]
MATVAVAVALPSVQGDDAVGRIAAAAAPPQKAGTKRHERQPSLRRANSVELTHRRMNSAGSNHGPTEAPSTAREGRQFTVANPPRPVIRPPPLKPPAMLFPAHGPSPSGAPNAARRRSSDLAGDNLWSGLATPHSPRTPTRSSRRSAGRTPSDLDSPPVPRLHPQHQRAHSFSTLSEKTRSHEADGGGVRVIINSPEKNRPRTADQLAGPMLEVAIPNYRLGSPRFSARGTAILRSSVYTRTSTTDGLRASAFSDGDYDQVYPLPPGMPRASHGARLDPDPFRTAAHVAMHRPHPGVHHRAGEPVDPRIFDYLTFPPMSEHPSIVRYSPANGGIAAATPPRLIAQITSPNFLDYDLLSDFFLTFRSFMPAADLLAYLMARLQWAVDRRDDVGKIVKVRTFVALRHWVLNYFVDDFVPNRALRTRFCALLREVCDALEARPDHGMSDFKLIGELKKCWRRTCDLYWDGPKIDQELAAHEDIRPGGPTGSPEDLMETPGDFSTRPVANPVLPQGEPRPGPDAASPFPIPSQRVHPPLTPQPGKATTAAAAVTKAVPMAAPRALSGASESSMHALSCSLPTKSYKNVDAVLLGAPTAHPIEIDPAMDASASMASASVPANPPLFYSLERSGSFSDAPRRQQPSRARPASDRDPSSESIATLPPGSLIRGSLIAPSQLLVRPIVVRVFAHEPQSRSPGATHEADPDLEAEPKPNGGSGPGMRKLLGTVRRALSTKNGWVMDTPPMAGYAAPMTHTERRYSPTSRLNLAKGHVKQPSTPSVAPVRIDLLHEKVYESFRQISKEQLRAAGHMDHRLQFLWEQLHAEVEEGAGALRHDPLHDLPATERDVSGVSMGSKSIVIVNDTAPPPPPLPLPLPAVEGPTALETWRSAEGLPLPVKPIQSLSPAQPDMPESHPVGASGRRSLSVDQTPSRGITAGARQHPATPPQHPESTYPPSSRSRGRSFKSTRSVSLRKYASFQGSVRRHDTLRSFDTTTLTGSDLDGSAEYLGGAPVRQLRRRPGGDLRAAHKITELGVEGRPRSAGSLFTTRSTSIGSSILRMSGSVATGGTESEVGREQRRRFSLGALAEVGDEKLSLMHTHSSQPNLRASFEAEVAKLARLPDEDDDGGIESTLLKLEGRFQRRGSDESPPDYSMPASSSRPGTAPGPDRPTTPGASATRPVPHSPSVLSEESYSSIPLLERGLSEPFVDEDGRSHACSSLSTPRASTAQVPHPSVQTLESPSRRRPRRTLDGLAQPRPQSGHESFLLDEDDPRESFLLDEDEDLSDLSSELSLDGIPEINVKSASSTSFPPEAETMLSDHGLTAHPLRHPPSPPPSAEPTAPVNMASKPSRFLNPPLTPEASPVDHALSRGLDRHRSPSPGYADHAEPGRGWGPAGSARAVVVHIPFILGYEAEVVAQQLTLCEKDALSEIDWRDLVELRWRQTLPPVHNWVEYLKAQEPRGVELVIARFNVMVKWALSEIVMTREVHERARTLSKFIQIAKHARRYRNYATMYQLTVALLSTDCSRLTETWKLVPAVDVRALKVLENLIQPVRNFHNLRVEMETGTAEEGCIPFLGIYTHDLVFNSHRPSRVAGAGGTESLVNFERYRTTASVVKNLLRLIEGSTKYNFPPIDGLIDRCLWMAALPDPEIRALSKTIR